MREVEFEKSQELEAKPMSQEKKFPPAPAQTSPPSLRDIATYPSDPVSACDQELDSVNRMFCRAGLQLDPELLAVLGSIEPGGRPEAMRFVIAQFAILLARPDEFLRASVRQQLATWVRAMDATTSRAELSKAAQSLKTVLCEFAGQIEKDEYQWMSRTIGAVLMSCKTGRAIPKHALKPAPQTPIGGMRPPEK